MMTDFSRAIRDLQTAPGVTREEVEQLKQGILALGSDSPVPMPTVESPATPAPMTTVPAVTWIEQPASTVCGKYSKPHRWGGILGPCLKKPASHEGWHLGADGAAWDPSADSDGSVP